MFKKTTIGLIALIALSGCDKTTEENTAVNMSTKQNSHVEGAVIPPSKPSEAVMPYPVEGKVISSINAAGYTYAEVDAGGRSYWVAGTETQISAGDEVYWGKSAVMKDFYSKTLDRSFKEILFVSALQNKKEMAQKAANNPNQGNIVHTMTGGGYTYLQVKRSNGEEVWIAAPETAVKENDTVSWNGGVVMSDFTSSTLNKTFEKILFVSGISIVN